MAKRIDIKRPGQPTQPGERKADSQDVKRVIDDWDDDEFTPENKNEGEDKKISLTRIPGKLRKFV